MKIGVVGSGLVGSTAAFAAVLQRICNEVVLVDLDEARAKAEAADLLHAGPFGHPASVTAGSYDDLAGSGVIVIAAGSGMRPGQSRLDLLARNTGIIREVVGRALARAPGAILLVATNPVDVMTHVAALEAQERGTPAGRVFGTGTTLDTARFRALLGRHLDVDPHHVHAYVIGEHGDSEVLTWSLVNVAGLALDDYLSARRIALTSDDRRTIDEHVRRAAYEIIAGKGATYYGIGAAIARIAGVIAYGRRAVLTVCSRTNEVLGVEDVTLSLPRVVGPSGVMETLPFRLSPDERSGLRKSAEVLRRHIDEAAAAGSRPSQASQRLH